MAFPTPGTLSLTVPPLRIEEAEARIRANIASMRHSVLDSRRTIVEAREAIAWANRVLARQISDPHEATLRARRYHE
jgi:ribosome-binding protein aMBF1 (putative translation factor)